MKTVNGLFDGKVVILDEPGALNPNTKVTVIALDSAETDSPLARDFTRLSEPAFKQIWDNQLDADYDHL